MSVWQLETSIDWLKSIRASFPCKSRHLWKRSIVWVTITRDLLKRMCLIYTYRLNNKYIFSEKSYTIIRFMQCSSSKSSFPGIWQSPSGMRKRKWNETRTDRILCRFFRFLKKLKYLHKTPKRRWLWSLGFYLLWEPYCLFFFVVIAIFSQGGQYVKSPRDLLLLFDV